MKRIRRILAVLLVLTAAITAYLWLEPPALLRIGANYAAKIVCSNVYLAGRDAAAVLDSDVQAPGVFLLKLLHVTVDRPRGIVRAGFFGLMGNGLAAARPGIGCTALPDGKLGVALSVLPPAADVLPATAMRSGTAVDAAAASPWPDGSQATLSPAIQRVVDSDSLVGPGMRAVVVVDHGRIVGERYGAGFDAGTPLLGWSMSKTVVAALVGVLVKDGKLSLDQAGFWPPGDGRDQIKLSDLLAMSSGLRFDELYGLVSDVTRMLYLEPDTAGYARQSPLARPIGEIWSYSSGTANIVSSIVQQAAGGADFVRERLFKPLGMTSAVMERDEAGTVVGSSYLYATGRDWARFGQFLAQDGTWRGESLLPAGYVDMMATPVAASGGEYGHGFVWLWASDPVAPGQNPDAAFGIPPDTFYLSGHDGQTIAVIRSRQLVIVRLGLTPYVDHYSPQRLIQALLQARP